MPQNRISKCAYTYQNVSNGYVHKSELFLCFSSLHSPTSIFSTYLLIFSQENLRSKMRNTTFFLMAFQPSQMHLLKLLVAALGKGNMFLYLCPCRFVRVYSALLCSQKIVSCNLSVLWGQALCFIAPYGACNFSKGAATRPYFHTNFPQERLRAISSLPGSPPFAWRTYCDFLCTGDLLNTLV